MDVVVSFAGFRFFYLVYEQGEQIGSYGWTGSFEEMAPFWREMILEGDGVNDSTIGGGAIECCFADGEDGVREEGSMFLSDRHRFSLKDTFSCCSFSAFSKEVSYFSFCVLSCSA